MTIRVCLTTPHEDQDAANAVSIQENPANAPLPVQQDPTDTVGRRLRLALTAGRFWKPGQTLRVHLEGSSPSIQQRVKDLASQWCQYANIKFLFVDALPADIRVTFDQRGGSWSALGTESRLPYFQPPKSTMNLELNESTSPDYFTNTVLHEFGHALGCIHEHQSPARGINWNKPAVLKWHSRFPDWPPARVEKWIFSIDQTGSLHSEFDPQSVMMYSIPADWTTDGFSTPENTTLSANDKAWIAKVYPFDSSGASGIANRSEIATVSWSTVGGRVYFQDTSNDIREVRCIKGKWSGGGAQDALVTAKAGSPLAAIYWDHGDGHEIRIYYLDEKNFLREYSHSPGSGWSPGSLNNSGFKAAPYSKLAAVRWFDDNKPTSDNNIRIYLQEPGSNAIRSINGLAKGSRGPWKFSWSRGTTLPVALAGTSIAAVLWFNKDLNLRVYYQDANLALQSHAWDGKWAPSQTFKAGTAPAKTPITALAWLNPNIQVRVYYQNRYRNIEEYRFPWPTPNSDWGHNENTEWAFESVGQPGLLPGVPFAASVYGRGHETAIYYQGIEPGQKGNALLEDRFGQAGTHSVTALVKLS